MEAGFQEIEHTADWELHVWAPDLKGLLEQAARGMYQLSGMRLADEPRLHRSLDIQAADAESLLVRFLSELLYFGDQEGLGFDSFDLSLENLHLKADLGGARHISSDKEIKAVTYHRLKVRQTGQGLEVNIVFDV